MPTTRAAVYLRQSQDKSGEELAVSRQREDCEALCKAKGWSPVEYVDNDKSASNGKARPEYRRMLADIKAGLVGAVVVWDLDRLHRRPVELENFMQLADERKLKLATVTGECDLSTDNGRLYARIKGAVAASEVERKSARQKRAAKQLAETDARPWWPSRPFGFKGKPDPATGEDKWWVVKREPGTKAITAVNTITHHPKEARLVKQAYTDFLNEGRKLIQIAADWNTRGITPPSGKPWTPTGVRLLLLAGRNAGLREHNGEVVLDKGGNPKRGTWPEIVSEETWRAACSKLRDPKRRCGVNGGRRYLLSGIAQCGRCGARVTSGVSTAGVRLYSCIGCYRLSRNQAKVDQLVIERVVWRLSREDAVDLLRPPEDSTDPNALRAERKILNERLVQLGKDYASAPPAFTQAALAEIQTRMDEINDQLADPGKVRIFDGVIGAKDVRKAFLGLELARRRTIVDALMTVTINPSRPGPYFDATAIDLPWK